MKLYHGTSYKNGMQILSDGCIKSKVERHFDTLIFNTTQGYVYLSSSICVATAFGNILAYKQNQNKLVVFEVDIPKDKLLPDYDELKIQAIKNNCKFENITADLSLKETQCAAIDHDVDFSIYKSKYTIIPSTLYGEDISMSQAIKTKSIVDCFYINQYKDTNFEEKTRLMDVFRFFETCDWVDI